MGKHKFEVEGEVLFGAYQAGVKIQGLWNESMFMNDLKSSQETLIWSKSEPLPNSEQFYHMSFFALQLNHLTRAMKCEIAPTDSRLRPDIR